MLGNQAALQTPGPQPPGIPQVAAAMGQAQPVRPPSKCCWSCSSGVFGLQLILRLCSELVLLTFPVLCCRWAYVHANRAYQSYAGFSRYLFSSLIAICGFKIIVGVGKVILCWGFLVLGGSNYRSCLFFHCSVCQGSANNMDPALCWGWGINSVLPKRGQLKQEYCG